MRPQTLDEVVGQSHLLGKGRALHRVIDNGIPVSLLFWGPPGSGKTTLARLIASEMNALFVEYSAVLSGVKQIREVIAQARILRAGNGKQTILFIDEIHRFNKVQQDAFLPHVENGVIILIGATTENPSFEIIPALLSRCRVFTLKPLNSDDLRVIVRRSLEDSERGLTEPKRSLTKEAETFLVESCGGDARIALGTLEFAAQLSSTESENGNSPTITLDLIAEALQTRPVKYDKSGDQHFNLISAFQKSIRGSDPDAALYWMCRMLEGGEDPLYIARRLIRIASEDVGLADPNALPMVVAARQAYQMLGSPEGDLALAEAVIYLATAPKSNSVEEALNRARERASETGDHPVSIHLRNAPTRLIKDAGYGEKYIYDHNEPGGYAGQDFLPEKLIGETYYQPKSWGYEREIIKRMEWWSKRKRDI
ncbi:replication-associated recombination protein A, partial [bacterium]|nr:replication-associated recombination protein A [bacterium]